MANERKNCNASPPEIGQECTASGTCPRRKYLGGTCLLRVLQAGEACRQVLERIPQAIFLLDSARRLLHANTRAEALLRAGDGLQLHQGRLRVALLDDQRLLDRVMEAFAAGATGPRHFALHRPSGRLAYQVTAHPLSMRVDEAACGDPELPRWRTACLLHMIDPEATPEVSEQRLSAYYDLTPSEARLCAFLYVGLSLSEAAARMRISRNTAKTHLRHVFAKCRVSSQNQLMRLLALVGE